MSIFFEKLIILIDYDIILKTNKEKKRGKLMLKKELEKMFKLNKMQETAYRNKGKNLVFNAPTGSGKTEAVLLSIEEGKNVTFANNNFFNFYVQKIKRNWFF